MLIEKMISPVRNQRCPSITIRKVQPDKDLDDILEIFDSLSEKDRLFTALNLSKKVDAVISYIQKGHAFVAVADDGSDSKVVGVLVYETYPDTKFVLLDEMVIDNDYRKLGIGRRLMETAHRMFRKTTATTDKHNHKIESILKKLGYEKLQENIFVDLVYWVRIEGCTGA